MAFTKVFVCNFNFLISEAGQCLIVMKTEFNGYFDVIINWNLIVNSEGT